MRSWVLLAVLLVSSLAIAAPPTSPRIAALTAQLAKHERGAEDAFWAQIAKDGGPIVEPGDAGNVLVTFVWRGNAKTRRVALWGPLRTTGPAELARVPGSNVFYVTGSLPATARFTYSFAIDDEIDSPKPGIPPHGDPFNLHVFDPSSSALVLPQAPAQTSLGLHRGTQAGALYLHRIDKRAIYVYTPPGYTATGPAYPLVVAFDADTALVQMPMPVILDELIASKQIPPVIAVLVGNVDRFADLSSDAFTDMIALDLVPWMRATYHATSDPRRTVITGVSLGGLASATTALHHPEVFGNVLSQSGSFWWAPDGEEPESTSRWLAKAPHVAVRFWMEVGLFEGGRPDQQTSMLAANRHLRDVLTARGNDVIYSEFAGNHSYLQWRGSLAGGLVALFAAPPKSAAPAAKPTKRTPLAIGAATRSPIAQIARTACLDGGDAALAAAKDLGAGEEDVDTAALAAFYLDHARDALPLLRWNTERFAQSSNAWDSLAWVQFATGDRKAARASFQKVLEVAPEQPLAKRMLDLL
jgi:enterochelin esterase-like enzyme